MAIWKVRAWMLTIPVIVAAVEWPMLGARLSGSQCVGGGLVLGGLALLIRLERAAPATCEADAGLAPAKALVNTEAE